MSLDLQLSNVQQVIPECIAVGVVDIQTGMLLGIKTVDEYPQEILDLVAAATSDLFQGQNVVAIETMFKQMRGVSDHHHYCKEVIILCDNLILLFQRGKSNEDIAVVAVCNLSANLGMALVKTRSALPSIEAEL